MGARRAAIPTTEGTHYELGGRTHCAGFYLKDQNQKEVSFRTLPERKKVVLVFIRSTGARLHNEHACFVNEMKQFETLDAEVLA